MSNVKQIKYIYVYVNICIGLTNDFATHYVARIERHNLSIAVIIIHNINHALQINDYDIQ